jgi:peptide chain release factor 2
MLAKGEAESAQKRLHDLESKIFLSGKYDSFPALFSIHAGQGGTEAMDWSQMLQRMFMKYFERKDWDYQILEETPGEEAGIKSVTFLIDQPYAYGYLKYEAGTHRLVRQSPFNADNLRQTSFALVEVLPEIEEKEEVPLNEDDLQWQFFRASTQGGQNVQKVSTAVRLTHEPTGITVTCEQERSQEQNRKIALKLLRAKLWQKEEEKRQKEFDRLKKGRTKAAWGTQIRSYVLHPYKMVKDLRTNVEIQEVDDVLDGELDEFIQAEIRQLSKVG